MTDLAKRLLSWRRRKKVSQRYVAKQLRCSTAALSLLLNDKWNGSEEGKRELEDKLEHFLEEDDRMLQETYVQLHALLHPLGVATARELCREVLGDLQL